MMKTPLRRHVQPTAEDIAERNCARGRESMEVCTSACTLFSPSWASRTMAAPLIFWRGSRHGIVDGKFAANVADPRRADRLASRSEPSVRRACRIADLDGPFASLADILGVRRRSAGDGRPFVLHPQVEVVTDTVVLDLHETSRSDDVTGVARVATEIARRWDLSHEVVLVGWSSDGTALRRLAPSEISCTVTGLTKDNRDLTPTILVPWHCTYALPELLGETNRVGRFPGLSYDIRTIKVLSSATTACHSRLEKLEQRPRLEPSLVTFLPSLILTAWPLFPQRPPSNSGAGERCCRVRVSTDPTSRQFHCQ